MDILIIERPIKDIKGAYENARDKIEKIIENEKSDNLVERRKTLKKILNIKTQFSINFSNYHDIGVYNDKLKEMVGKYKV